MELIVAGQTALGAEELKELALGVGVDPDLFAGVPGESADEERARLDVAREVERELDLAVRGVARRLIRAGAERPLALAWKAAA
ncbi:hypothetical protein ACI1MP_20015 [Kitasatospora griseola]|uniref:hypothetical protein n=1 Tax=Kitasatospora griseola TaxID=2064 RepID=UPI0038558845